MVVPVRGGGYFDANGNWTSQPVVPNPYGAYGRSGGNAPSMGYPALGGSAKMDPITGEPLPGMSLTYNPLNTYSANDPIFSGGGGGGGGGGWIDQAENMAKGVLPGVGSLAGAASVPTAAILASAAGYPATNKWGLQTHGDPALDPFNAGGIIPITSGALNPNQPSPVNQPSFHPLPGMDGRQPGFTAAAPNPLRQIFSAPAARSWQTPAVADLTRFQVGGVNAPMPGSPQGGAAPMPGAPQGGSAWDPQGAALAASQRLAAQGQGPNLWDPQGAGYAAAQRMGGAPAGPTTPPQSPFTMIMRPNAPAGGSARGGGGPGLTTALDLSGWQQPVMPPAAAPAVAPPQYRAPAPAVAPAPRAPVRVAPAARPNPFVKWSPADPRPGNPWNAVKGNPYPFTGGNY